MLSWTLDLARTSGADTIAAVWGAHSPAVRDAAEAAGALTALQDPPLGTGHAVLQAKPALSGFSGDVIVLYADTPLIRPETVQAAFEALDAGAGVAVVGFEPADAAGYGRLILAEDGSLERIVEHKDATVAERSVGLCNSGVLAVPADLLFALLEKVGNDNAKGEYYLTDVVGLAREAGRSAVVVRAAQDEVLGVNSRSDLAAAEAAFQARKRSEAMAAGVTLIAPETVFFSHDTQIDPDVVVEPNVVFASAVSVKTGAVIRAFSHLEGAEVGEGAQVGPYARLRPGTVLGAGARIGNFVETKKAEIGAGAKVNHLSYVGDARIGAQANIGAGTITCNYDGFDKHLTVIGEGAFIGSNTALVAPVTVGAGAYTGSGGVITADVPADALAIARAKQDIRPGWAARYRAAKTARKTSARKAEGKDAS